MADLGILGSGPIASVDDAGTVRLGGEDWSLRWWVAGEDRWHRFDADQAVRSRVVDEMPVVETSIRVPSGDVVATTYAFAGVAGGAEVVSRLSNDSPLPVATALVVGPAERIELIDGTVSVGGRPVARLDRRVAAAVGAADLDELADGVQDATSVVSGPVSGYLALVAPLPHAQAVAVVAGFDDEPSPVPAAERVEAGWEAQIDRGVRLLVPSPSAEALRRGRVALVMGPSQEADLLEVAVRCEAALRLGWFEDATEPTERLVAAQRGRGGFGHDRETLAAVEALAAWRVAGVPPEHLEHVVLAVAAGAHRLRRRRSKGDVPVAAADAAIAHAAWMLRAAGEGAAADELRPAGSPPTGPRARLADEAIAAVAVELDRIVLETDDGVDLLAGWDAGWMGASVEVTDLPTRFGRVSFALRWHGERPALLWEVDRWDGPVVTSPELRATALDPTWSSHAPSGEALLAAPGNALQTGPGPADSFS